MMGGFAEDSIETVYQIQLRQHRKHDYTKFQVKIQIVFRVSTIFAKFTIGIIGSFVHKVY